MIVLNIYHTLRQRKEPFKPRKEEQLYMYVYGMTVYDYCHIGHARVMVAFDVITRYLRHRGYHVTYVRNITDVDDKIFNRANENGEPFTALTARFIDAMHEDERALGVLSPDQEPRATQHSGEIIAMIETLLAKEYAYTAANGDVYYDIAKFADYGKLNRRDPEQMMAGARVEVDAHKRNPMDFVLWKAAKAGEAAWESPWGAGRPGWHIECSAMSTQCLGHTFDIHGGGPDLKFPHHENEIAQSEAATGCNYVNYWLQAGAVAVNKETMSKPPGNFFTIREVLEKYPPEVVRYFLISSHYRSQVDYSEESLREARASLERLYRALRGVDAIPGHLEQDYAGRFAAAMDDDFNTPGAVAVLFELARDINRAQKDGADAAALAAELRRLAGILGLLQDEPEVFLQAGSASSDGAGLTAEAIEALIVQRNAARKAKDFAESDRIRDLLKAQGIVLNDSREGTSWERQTD